MSSTRTALNVSTLIAMGLTVLAISGCSQSSASVPPREVAITPVDRDAYDAIVAGHRGKVVLVDVWATWCVPCVEQFSHTVKLAGRYGDGLVAVSVNMDDPADAAAVLTFLRSEDASSLVNLASRDGGGPASMVAFEITGGSLPHYKLYDRAGRLRYTFSLDPAADRQYALQDIDTAVELLLTE